MIVYSIIGLNQVGVSIAMALAGKKNELICVGLDRDTRLAHEVEKNKAFHQILYNLRGAVEKADAVILCVPFDEVKETLEAISGLLKPGAVVLDTSLLKKAPGEWAEAILAEANPFIGIYPTIKPEYEKLPRLSPQSARPDLFEGRIMFLATGGKTSQAAIQFASGLSEMVGSASMFIDREEFDGNITAFELLGQAVTSSVYSVICTQLGNKDGQKMAGASFGALGNILARMDEREFLGQSWIVDRQVLSQYLGMVAAEIKKVQSLLDPARAKDLESYLQSCREYHAEWERHHLAGEWDRLTNKPVLSPGQVLVKLVEFPLLKNKNKKSD